MTSEGGAHGDGNVFKVTPGGAQSVVYSFQYGADGSNPVGNLVQGSDGNFYGMTAWGGMPGFNGLGIVFKLTPGGTETVLHSFMSGTSDGRIASNAASGAVLPGNDPSLIPTVRRPFCIPSRATRTAAIRSVRSCRRRTEPLWSRWRHDRE